MEVILIINLVFLGILTGLLIILSVDEAKREKQNQLGIKDKKVKTQRYKEVA